MNLELARELGAEVITDDRLAEDHIQYTVLHPDGFWTRIIFTKQELEAPTVEFLRSFANSVLAVRRKVDRRRAHA